MASHFIVTGGAGFIGSHLTDRLLDAGHRVTVIDDFSTATRTNLAAAAAAHSDQLAVIESRVSRCADLPGILRGAAGVFHLAAAVGVDLVIRSPINTIKTNLDETEVILDAASVAGVPVLLTSTSEVYGKSNKPEFSEDDDLLIGQPALGRWSYACSKLMDEFLAFAYSQERALPVIVARIFNTVGPRQSGRYGMVLPRFISAAGKNQPLRVFGNGQQTRCFCFVTETVEALVRLHPLAAAPAQVVNVGSSHEITILDLAHRVREITGSSSPVEFVPYDEAYAPGFEDMHRRKPSIKKLASLTGFAPATSIDDIIRKTAAAAAL